MLSALISSAHGYAAMPLTEQLPHQKCVILGPLVLENAMSRHRGAKPNRRYELLDSISLLSLAYLLSVERWQFHIKPSDHLGLLSHLLDLLVSQLTGLLPIRSTHGCKPC